MNGALVIVASIVGFFLLAFAAIHAWVYLTLWLQAVKLRAQLQKRHRTISLAEARQRMARNEGMIIVDSPTIGWNILRVWWSPRTDYILPPPEPPGDQLTSKEDAENHRRFIDLETGSACLVDGFVFGGTVQKYLLKHFQLEECPFIFTGAVLVEQRTPRERRKSPTDQNGAAQ